MWRNLTYYPDISIGILQNTTKNSKASWCASRNSEELLLECGPGSVVGIATGYGLDGPGIESRWGRDFPHLCRPALGPTQPLYNGYRVFPGGKERPGRDADPSLPSSAMVMNE